MTYPILYPANATDFSNLGLGVLNDNTECKVTEGRNNNFYLEMTYPSQGKLFKELKNDRLIKAYSNDDLKWQRFKITRITKAVKGLVKVYADHVSYHADELQLFPEVSFSGDAETALVTWKNNIVENHEFTVWSDIDTTNQGSWSIRTVDSARKALFGVQGSLLQTYGGEYRFDNYHISLFRNRGSDKGAIVAFGKNLIELEQEEQIATTYTSVYPYAVVMHDDGEEELITLPEYYIDSEYVGNYARKKIMLLDLSEDGVDNVETLRSRTEQFIISNDVGVPSVNLRVKMVDLAKTLDYKHLRLVQQINLCDWVTVKFKDFGIDRRAKVIKTVWDVNLDRYDEIELGDARASLSTRVEALPVDEQLEAITRYLSIVQMQANGKNKIYRGVEEPEGDLVEGDLWYKPVGNGEVEMYHFDGAVWSLESISGSTIGGTIDGRATNVIFLNASAIASGTLDLSTGLSIGYQDLPVLRANANGEVEMNVSRLQINNFDPEADSVRREDLEAYMRYENGTIYLGEVGNEVITEFSNDTWAMVRNHQKVMWLEEDTINIEKAHFFRQAQIGNFAFLPRNNGSLSFKKVGE